MSNLDAREEYYASKEKRNNRLLFLKGMSYGIVVATLVWLAVFIAKCW